MSVVLMASEFASIWLASGGGEPYALTLTFDLRANHCPFDDFARFSCWDIPLHCQV